MTPCLALPNERTESQARGEAHAKRAMLALVKLSPTMAAINRAVEKLPPMPLGAPLPVFGTTDEYLDQPCSTPRARFGVGGVGDPCVCGFEIGDHYVR